MYKTLNNRKRKAFAGKSINEETLLGVTRYQDIDLYPEKRLQAEMFVFSPERGAGMRND